MAKKDWGNRWGDQTNEGEFKRLYPNDYKSLSNYIKCCGKGKQCLPVNQHLINLIKTNLMFGLKEFDVTKVSGLPTSMVKGDPRVLITISNKSIRAYYKGKGKWKIIAG